MASEVDICNLGLAHLGDVANLQSINPPDGSAQADHCARFYPIARDSLLEMQDWGFATKRATLALLSAITCSEWLYAYAAPADFLNPIAILDPNAGDDSSVGISTGYLSGTYSQLNGVVPYGVTERGAYTTQPYTQEVAPDGSTIILWSNQVNATLRYTAKVIDTTKFSNLFIETLGWHLAGMLAGPVLKGESGIKAGGACVAMVAKKLGAAITSDANNKTTNVRDRQAVAWINGR